MRAAAPAVAEASSAARGAPATWPAGRARRSPAAPPSRGSAGRRGRGGRARSAARSTCRRRRRRSAMRRRAERRAQRPRGPRRSPSSRRRRAPGRGARRSDSTVPGARTVTSVSACALQLGTAQQPGAPGAARVDDDEAVARLRRRRATACQTGPKVTPGWPGPPVSASSGIRAKTRRVLLARHAQADRARRRAGAVARHREGRALEAVRVRAVAEGERGVRRTARASTGAEAPSRAQPAPAASARQHGRGHVDLEAAGRRRARATSAPCPRSRTPVRCSSRALEVGDDRLRSPRPPAAGRGRRWRRSPSPARRKASDALRRRWARRARRARRRPATSAEMAQRVGGDGRLRLQVERAHVARLLRGRARSAPTP